MLISLGRACLAVKDQTDCIQITKFCALRLRITKKPPAAHSGGYARDGVAVAAYAQGLSGRDGVSLAGAGELAAEPAVLVQAAAGGLDPPVCVTPPILTGSDPQTVMSRSIAAAVRSSPVAWNSTARRGARFALVASEPALRVRTA